MNELQFVSTMERRLLEKKKEVTAEKIVFKNIMQGAYMMSKYIYTVNDLSLNEEDLLLHETLFHNANGYLGVRSNFEEGYPESYPSIRGMYINGFYDFAEMRQAESLYGLVEEKQTMLNVADTQGISLEINGEKFSMFEGEVLKSFRTLDMEKGITKRHIVWRSPHDDEIEIDITRMASFTMLPLFTIQYQVKAINFSGEIKFTSTHLGDVENFSDPNDPRVAGANAQYIHVEDVQVQEDTSLMTSKTSKSDLTVWSAVSHDFSKEGKINIGADDTSATFEFITTVRENETVECVKYTILCDSIRGKDGEKCLSLLREAQAKKLMTLYDEQEDFLKEYWDSSQVDIYGDDDLSSAIYYNLYQLMQSVGKDPYSNIAAKGLSGEGYEGHYFWDTEMYIQPFFLLTQPHLTRNLIAYRYEILDYAREHAKIMGHDHGALYPWRTIMGKECSGYYPSGSAQYHINGDIAYSIINYYLVTKDLQFMADKAAEIIFETARLWLDVGHMHDGKFMIHQVTGPDEYTCVVDNNYYTNALAQYHLNWAVKFYDLLATEGLTKIFEKISLTETEVNDFKKAADLMYLPYDEALDINPQDDSFLSKKVWDLAKTPEDKFPLLLHYHPLHLYRYQVCKQADTVLSHFILEDLQPLRTIENSFLYYENITTHDSSLSTCIFSIMASKLKMHDKAYEYFGESAKIDLFNTHKNTKDGIHTANMGGNYMAIVYGFGGLRVKEEGISFVPSIPEKWTGYEFRMKYGEHKIFVQVNKDTCSFTLMEGNRCPIKVYGKSYVLTDPLVVPLEAR